METYNGWSNFETWKINLEFGLNDRGFENYDDEMLKDYIESYIEENCDNEILKGMLWNFISEVNWQEIAEHIEENKEIE